MDLPLRKKVRLKDYDYSSSGLYFITICVKDKKEMLGQVGAIINRPQVEIINFPPTEIINHTQTEINNHQHNSKFHVELSEYGIIADKAINEIPAHYKNVTVDRYVIMPNHIHLILEIQNNETDGRLIITRTVSTIIKQLKRHVSRESGFSLWQKSFYDHIIRDEEDYFRIAEYIENNPLKWTEDIYFEQR